MENTVNNDKDLTQGAVARHVARLSGFMMLGMLSFNLATLCETIYVGMVGTNELAAISFTYPLVFTLQAVSMGLSVGASSVVARSIGLGDMQKVRLLTTHCLLLSIMFTTLLGIIVFFYLLPMFSLLGADAAVLPLVVDYMSIWLIGLPVFALSFVGTSLMRASGDAFTPGVLSTVGSVAHVVIAPFLIFGLGPFPELGLQGAAISFVVARTIAFLALMYVFVFRQDMLSFELRGLVDSSKEILHVGLPALTANLIMPVSMAIITRLLAGHGTAVVAGYGVAARIEFLAILVIFSTSVSVSPVIGQNWGAGMVDRVKETLRLANGFVLLYGVFAYVMLLIFGEFFIGLINDDPAVRSAAYNYLIIGPMAVGLMGVMQNSTNAFNALGKPMPPLIISLLRMIVINIPLALIGNYLFGYQGIFIAGVVTTIMLAIASWLWINRTVDTSARRMTFNTENTNGSL